MKTTTKQVADKLGRTLPEPAPFIPTGHADLDEALGVGGYPRGCVIEIYGPEGIGKSSLALGAIAQAQRLGIRAAFVDVDGHFVPGDAQKLGVDFIGLLVSQPNVGDELAVAMSLATTPEIGLVVIDSTPSSDDRALGQALRRLTAWCFRHRTTVIFVTHLRQRIGAVFGAVDKGGNALKFYSSVRIDVRAKRQAGRLVGQSVRVVKNKAAAPFKTAEIAFEEPRKETP